MSTNDTQARHPDEVITPERYRENLEVALTTLITVCQRWPDAPLVVQRAIDVGRHVPPTLTQLLTDKVVDAFLAAAPTSDPACVERVRKLYVARARYMTAYGKEDELEGWERAKMQRETAPPTGFVGGHGYPDPEIYGWVDRLNAMHRVCTLQSCAGHVCTLDSMCGYCESQVGGPPHETHVMSGQLWLWLDEKLTHWFHEHALTLASNPLIEKLTVLYHVEGREIVDVVFRGAGSGELDASMQVIAKFFEDGNRTCNMA